MEQLQTTHFPALVADWLSQRDALLTFARQIEAVDDARYEAAAHAVSEANAMLKELETQRKAVTAPLDKAKKAIMAEARQLGEELEAHRDRLRALCGAYMTARERERAEALRVAQEREADRAIRQEDAAEAFGGELREEAGKVEVLVPGVPRSSEVRKVCVYTFEVTDEAKLDRKFLRPDEARIRAYCQYLKSANIDPETIEEPGLVFRREYRIDSK